MVGYTTAMRMKVIHAVEKGVHQGIEGVDSVSVSFISKVNEIAIIDGYYNNTRGDGFEHHLYK